MSTDNSDEDLPVAPSLFDEPDDDSRPQLCIPLMSGT